MRPTSLLLLALPLLVVACADANDLFVLRGELAHRYDHDELQVMFRNGEELWIAFVNSKLGKLDKKRKEATAREIASFAKKRYASIGKVKRVTVSFVTKSNDIIIGRSDFVNYEFDKAKLQ